VDDLVLTGNDPQRCTTFKDHLHQCFKLKNLGPLKYFKGIEVSQAPAGIFLCQHKYALDILTETSILGSKPSSFLMEHQHKLSLDTSDSISAPGRYMCLISHLIYLTVTYPEITY